MLATQALHYVVERIAYAGQMKRAESNASQGFEKARRRIDSVGL